MRSRLLAFTSALLLTAVSFAQSTTRDPGTTTTTSTDAPGRKKILIVPFNPKMYMSEIDKNVNKETGQTAAQIKNSFRTGLNDQLKKQFKTDYNVVTMLDDSAKSAKDLNYIYSVVTCEYTATEDALKPDAVKAQDKKSPDSANQKGTTTTAKTTNPNISKGQISTVSDDREKYMNTVILSPNLLAYLKKNYGADYVVFINELDLKNDLGDDPYNFQNSSSYQRTASVHYTVVDAATSKRIAAGLAKSTFTSSENKPQKIADNNFSAVAKAIVTKFKAGVK